MTSECLDYNAPEHSVTGAQLSLFSCHGQGGNQVLELSSGFTAALRKVGDVDSRIWTLPEG